MSARCNCENAGCLHAPGRCEKRTWGSFRVDLLGEVCTGCFGKYPERYRATVEADKTVLHRRVETVRELRHLLFDIVPQDAEVIVLAPELKSKDDEAQYRIKEVRVDTQEPARPLVFIYLKRRP